MKRDLARGGMPLVVALVLWAALAAPCGLLAQTTTGTLRGTVKDETGGVLTCSSVTTAIR